MFTIDLNKILRTDSGRKYGRTNESTDGRTNEECDTE